MKITDLLKKDTVMIDLAATSKEAAIDEMTKQLHLAGRLNDVDGFKEAILHRESQSTTGIGEGVAIPHAKTAAVNIPSILFAKSIKGVDFESIDGQKAHLLFMIAASEGASNEHLETLSRLSSLLMDATLRDHLMAAQSPEEVIRIVEAGEKALDDIDERTLKNEDSAPLILAVTACPTGIAHTYMAADALKAKAQQSGIAIKVETNGSTGIKNALTAEEIAKATAIIVAADKQVEMNRFAGKHVVKVPVAAAIRKPGELLDRALQQNAPIYQVTVESSVNSTEAITESRFKEYFYKPLMNGVSNMLPFVVGGGLLIALSFLIGGINAQGPIAETLNLIGGGNAFALLIPVLAGFIAMGIADRPGLAPGMVGGFLAASGGAGFLGGLVAGFLAGYVVVGLKKLFYRLPQSFEGIKPVLLYPFFSMVIVGFIMIYVVNTPVKFIMDELTAWLNGLSGTNIVLVGMILAAMMAVDMGGPINKAAFTFGIAMIDAGHYAPQAAVMIGGMIPPLGLALATSIFKNKFTVAQRDAGKTNYIMGLSFITEGAIPFAAADPIRVIVSSVIGAAVAGGLALYFGCMLQAPHGGIFVIWAVQNPLMYLLSLIVGAVITAVIIGLWKQPIEENTAGVHSSKKERQKSMLFV